MKLVIPDNNDPELPVAVNRLVARPSNHIIGEIYGKPTKTKAMGSGRANLRSNGLDNEEMVKRVLQFKEMGIEYDYTLNGILPRARILENRGQIIEELEWLESSPITKVTIANYEVAKLAEKYAPSMDLAISFFAGVKSKKGFIQWAQLQNVKEINTDVATYRNLPLLEDLVNTGKKTDTDVRVIANLGCMSDCARKEEHAIIKDMASIDRENLHYAPCTYFCMKYNLENPEEFLKMPLIRPEDVKKYDDIGIASVKIVDRVQTTPWIEQVVGYYLAEEFDGNILDLTCTYTRLGLEKRTTQQVSEVDMKRVMESRAGVLQYREILPELMSVSIDPEYNLLACHNTCESCRSGCYDPSAVKVDPKRREIVLAQLNRLESEYLFK